MAEWIGLWSGRWCVLEFLVAGDGVGLGRDEVG